VSADPKVESAEVVLWVRIDRRLTVPELWRVRKAVNAVLNKPVNANVHAEHYLDDGTKLSVSTQSGIGRAR